MDITIHSTFLPHTDAEASLAFYRDGLDFEIRKDVAFGGNRWITIGPKGRPDTSIVLFPPWHALLVWFVAHHHGINAAIACGTLLPLCGMTARWFFRGRLRALRDVAVALRLLFSRALARSLRAERDRLVVQFDALGERVKQLRG